jgi:MFS family permease
MSPRIVLFIGNFFFSLFAALTLYVLLPFLSSFMPQTYTGLIVSAGGLVSMMFFPFMPRLVTRYGAQQLALTFALAEIIALLMLATVPSAIPASILIIITVAMQPFISYELDVLLEASTFDKKTIGRTRTLFLTAWNFGTLGAPLLLGAILTLSNDYSRVFIAAAMVLVPFVILLVVRSLPRKILPKASHLGDTLVCIARDPDLGAVTFAHFLLYLFYIWAPFYVPFYLHSIIGIPWSSLGWMFAVMLIPYALLEYPAGWLADRFLGDKKMMFAGFILAGSALVALSALSPSSSLSLILCILVSSRIGAALIESMTEGHFFRRVTEQDVNSISVFRGIWPLANIMAPLIGSFLLYFGGYQLFFICTGGFILLAGVATTSRIKEVL